MKHCGERSFFCGLSSLSRSVLTVRNGEDALLRMHVSDIGKVRYHALSGFCSMP